GGGAVGGGIGFRALARVVDCCARLWISPRLRPIERAVRPGQRIGLKLWMTANAVITDLGPASVVETAAIRSGQRSNAADIVGFRDGRSLIPRLATLFEAAVVPMRMAVQLPLDDIAGAFGRIGLCDLFVHLNQHAFVEARNLEMRRQRQSSSIRRAALTPLSSTHTGCIACASMSLIFAARASSSNGLLIISMPCAR